MKNCAKTALVATLLTLAGSQVQAQAYRCQVNGALVYQQVPCVGGGVVLKLPAPPPPAPPPAASRPAAQVPAPAPLRPEVVVVTVPASPPQRSDLEVEADDCLNWYRPMLRDPRSAYWRNAYYDRSVLQITVVATNAYGGFVNLDAACQFRAGTIDQGWTKVQAKRRDWAVN